MTRDARGDGNGVPHTRPRILVIDDDDVCEVVAQIERCMAQS